MHTFQNSKSKASSLKTFSIFLFIFLISYGLASAEDRRTDRNKLAVMTLNAEFLWDGIEPEEGSADFPWKSSQTEAEEHMRKVAEIIVRANPDIVNLVEVENSQALNIFNDKFLSGRGYKAYFVQGKDNSTGQDVTLLTRIDPEGKEIKRDDRKGKRGDTQKSVSKNYYAKIQAGNTKIALIGIHFLAMPNREDRKQQREAQAEAMRSLSVDLQNEGYSAIILGDFNDYDGEANSMDHIDSAPITDVLTIAKSMKVQNASDNLINASSFAPKLNRYTAFYDANRNGDIDPPREFTSIDHVLLSPNLAAKVESVEIPHNHDPREVTDHFPVIVHLKLAGSPAPAQMVKIRMVALLPNPQGNENQNEEITVKNFGTQSASLNSWSARDLSGKAWLLDELGTIAPGEEKTIKRNGQPMSLNNSGDTVDLVDPAGKVVQSVTYSHTDEDEAVSPVIE